LPATAITRSGNSLKMEWKGINGVFEGKIDSDLTTIVGTWTQTEHSFPLAVKRVKDAADLERHRSWETTKPYHAA
jgi:hypothetical protein